MIISGSPLWGPLGTVICFGLIISMVLTLYILPVLYSLAYRNKQKKQKQVSLSSAGMVVILVIAFSALSTKTEAQTLSLDSCKQLALENNMKIKKAEYKVKMATEQRKNAFTNYFPTISAGALAMRSADYLIKGDIPEMNLPVYDGNPANLATASQFAYIPSIPIEAMDYMNTVNLTVAMPLYAGGRIRNGNRLAKLGEDISIQQQQSETTEVLIHTEELYWTMVSLKEKKKTLDSYQTLLETLYKDVKNYEQAGLVQKNDLLKVQLKQNELKSNAFKLDNGIRLTTRALCQQIGITYDQNLVFNSVPDSLQIEKITETPNNVNDRIEIQMLNNAVEVKRLQQKMARGEFLPQIAIGAMGFYYDAMNSSSTNAIGFINVSIPISNWWGGSHKIKQQKFELEETQTTLNETTELLQLQVAQTSNELNESLFQIELYQKSIEQAKENLKISEDNYKAGTIGVSDLLEAQALYQSTLDNLTDGKCDYQIKKAKYLQSINSYK